LRNSKVVRIGVTLTVTFEMRRTRANEVGWGRSRQDVRGCRVRRWAVPVVDASGSGVPELLQDLVEELFHPVSDPGLLSLAIAGHVQRPDLGFHDPCRDV
jgi:hypothetical protein